MVFKNFKKEFIKENIISDMQIRAMCNNEQYKRAAANENYKILICSGPFLVKLSA